MKKDLCKKDFEKLRINTTVLSLSIALTGGLLLNTKLFATTSDTVIQTHGDKVITEKQVIEVDVLQDAQGNYVLKTEDFRDGSLEGGYECLTDGDKNGIISIDKEVVDKSSDEAIAKVNVIQTTKQELTQIQLIYHYTNYKKNMEYTVTHEPENILDYDGDKDRDSQDIMLGRYENATFENVVYKHVKTVIEHHDNIVQVNIYYEYK